MSPRLAVRAILLVENRLLLVNAYAGGQSDLWCAPGGGVERGSSLPDNLRREVHEECGLDIAVGDLALVNEFDDPPRGFHQVEVFFRCTLRSGTLDPDWRDPERIVHTRRFFDQAELATIRLKPDVLRHLPWDSGARYDPLERIAP